MPEDAFELIELPHEIDVAGVYVELKLFWLVEIGVKAGALTLSPVRWQREAVHHTGEPVEFNAVLVDVQQKDVFQHVLWRALDVLSRVYNGWRDVLQLPHFELVERG